jgi:hypothetical protein
MVQPQPVFWKDQLVGYMVDLDGEMWREWGKWRPANGQTAGDFELAVRAALAAREEQPEGIMVLVGTDRRVAEVTGFDDGEIDILYSALEDEGYEKGRRRWWHIWKRRSPPAGEA